MDGVAGCCDLPGTKLVTSLTDEMQLPNYCFWDSSTAKATGFMLNSISENTETGTVSFVVTIDDPSVIDEVRWQKADVGTILYDLQGRKVTHPTSGIYIMNGRKVVIK